MAEKGTKPHECCTLLYNAQFNRPCCSKQGTAKQYNVDDDKAHPQHVIDFNDGDPLHCTVRTALLNRVDYTISFFLILVLVLLKCIALIP